MGRRPRTITALDAEATTTRTEAEAPAPALASPVDSVEPDPAPEVPQRSPARQRLADAIETVRALETEVAQADAAIQPAREAVWSAQHALDEAEAVLAKARPREASTFTPGHRPPGAFWGDTYGTAEAARLAAIAAEAPPISITEAKAAEEAAKDALDSARAARQWHEDKLKRASQNLDWKRGSIGDAIRHVLRSEPALLALAHECRSLKTRAEAARQAFSMAIGGDVIQHGSPYYGWDTIRDVRTDPSAAPDWAHAIAWRAALDALRTDPDAPLPMPA